MVIQHSSKMLQFMANTLFYSKFPKKILAPLGSYSTNASNIVRSPVPDIKIPEILLDDCVWQNLDKWKHKTAVLCAETGRSYLYMEVYEKSISLSKYLRNKVPQLQEKDTVAIILPNIPEYAIIMLGLIHAGYKVTTVNANYKEEEIYKQVLNSNTKFIFTTSQLWPEVNKAVHKFKYFIPVSIVKLTQDEGLPSYTINFNEMIDTKIEGVSQVRRNNEDVCVLPYSSGTTGLPKGVELTHKNIVTNILQVRSPAFKFLNDSDGSFQETVPLILPMYHVYGMVKLLLHGLSTGCKFVMIPKFSPESFINVLEVYKPTVGYLTPPLLMFLLNSPKVQPHLIYQMRSITYGAAPLGASDVDRLRTKTGGKTNFLQIYGLSEATSACHYQTSFVENGIKIGGSGLTLPNLECLVKPLDVHEAVSLGRNVTGELLLKGPQIMKGYYNNPEATKAAIDADGWLRTGDVVYFDDDGHLYVTDRVKELIKVKGFQVAPAELEEVLRTHPDVEDAAVIGVPHSKWGEVPKAFIVPKMNTKVNTLEVEKYFSAKVAPFKQLAGGVVIIDSLPKTPSGKTIRRDLKDL